MAFLTIPNAPVSHSVNGSIAGVLFSLVITPLVPSG
jgi:hypothetical protein